MMGCIIGSNFHQLYRGIQVNAKGNGDYSASLKIVTTHARGLGRQA